MSVVMRSGGARSLVDRGIGCFDHWRRPVGVAGVAGLMVALLLLLGRTPARAAALACADGLQESGATYRICMPTNWNGKLLVYAHGYVAPNRPLGIPEDQLGVPGSPTVDQLANGLGYGFVMSGFRTNGLAVQQGIDDLVDAVAIFTAQQGKPSKVLLVGISEGGAITALAVERRPDIFDGGLAMCGPYGSFQDQINYFGDFRVIFDQLFPTLLPPSAVDVPATLLDTWESSYYTDTVQPVISATAQITAVNQLLAITSAPFDVADPATKIATIKDLLWYNVFATNDATVKLNGQPFDNRSRVYRGSLDDELLNQAVARYAADPAALTALVAYETTGYLARPLITLHTTGDPVVPYWHAIQYQAKVAAAGRSAFHEQMTFENYGHCQFTTPVILNAFNRLVALADNPPQLQLYLPLVGVSPQGDG
jgi:pimeloyl-ACP methyl ester carboxylesterase